METLDTAPDIPTVCDRAADVLHSMLFGTYGDRVRSHAQAEVGQAWTGQRLDDAPGVLTAVLEQVRSHMHPVHAGLIAQRVAAHLLDPDHEPAYGLDLDDDGRG